MLASLPPTPVISEAVRLLELIQVAASTKTAKEVLEGFATRAKELDEREAALVAQAAELHAEANRIMKANVELERREGLVAAKESKANKVAADAKLAENIAKDAKGELTNERKATQAAKAALEEERAKLAGEMDSIAAARKEAEKILAIAKAKQVELEEREANLRKALGV